MHVTSNLINVIISEFSNDVKLAHQLLKLWMLFLSRLHMEVEEEHKAHTGFFSLHCSAELLLIVFSSPWVWLSKGQNVYGFSKMSPKFRSSTLPWRKFFFLPQTVVNGQLFQYYIFFCLPATRQVNECRFLRLLSFRKVSLQHGKPALVLREAHFPLKDCESNFCFLNSSFRLALWFWLDLIISHNGRWEIWFDLIFLFLNTFCTMYKSSPGIYNLLNHDHDDKNI